MSLLAGPVVFIDDELTDPSSTASELLREIELTGRPTFRSTSVPVVASIPFDQWSALGFVVLDWDLSPGSGGAIGGSMLAEHERLRLFEFLDALIARVYCPIFVVSAEDTDDIRRQLRGHSSFVVGNDLDSRIAVFPKTALLKNMVSHLTDWVQGSPALSSLEAWDSEHEAAKNRMLLDLHALEPDWPVYIWNAALVDGVDPGFELASVISTNLLNRFNPIVFDANALEGYPGPIDGSSMRKVSQGRTSVSGDRLSHSMVFPGDLFQLPESEEGELWMNVSPVCQTVGRTQMVNGSPVVAPVRLHLIRGTKHPLPSSKNSFGALDNKAKGVRQFVVHTLVDESPYVFSFGEAEIRLWSDIRDYRVARLLPPFVTRAQQMHAAYMQSEGLPRVTPALYGIAE